MTKAEKVRKGIEACLQETSEVCKACPYHVFYPNCCVIERNRDALELLKEQQPRVLTHDEMTELGKTGGAVFIEKSSKGSAPQMIWALVTEGVEPPKDKPFNYPGGVYFNCVGEMGEIWDGDFYGLETPLGWRAWNVRPTDEQREATPWDEPPKEGEIDANK